MFSSWINVIFHIFCSNLHLIHLHQLMSCIHIHEMTMPVLQHEENALCQIYSRLNKYPKIEIRHSYLGLFSLVCETALEATKPFVSVL